MHISKLIQIFILCLVALLAGCAAIPNNTEKVPDVASDDVPLNIEKQLIYIAENSPLLEKSLRQDRVIYIGSEVIRRKSNLGVEISDKTYLVTHYRYNDDTAIHSLINLENSLVIIQKEFAHLPTSLSKHELDMAKSLAMKDARVREALGKDVDRVEIEALVVRATSQSDPWFGHRVMQLLFRVGRDYRHRPLVIVDLTDKVVLLNSEATRDIKGEIQ